jgi:hypothetical protein
MPSPFDHLRNSVFQTASAQFGYSASWVALDGLASYSGTVLFKHPAADYTLASMEIDPLRYYMEYLVGQMSGLAERVTSREARVLEVVTVDGVRYSVTSIIEMRDGDTIRATLVPERTQPTINRAL